MLPLPHERHAVSYLARLLTRTKNPCNTQVSGTAFEHDWCEWRCLRPYWLVNVQMVQRRLDVGRFLFWKGARGSLILPWSEGRVSDGVVFARVS